MDLINVFKDLISAATAAIGKVGGFIGGGARKIYGGARRVDDFILQPNGRLIETNPGDTIMGSKNGFNSGGVTLVVQGNLIGLDEQDISKRLSEELSGKVSL